MPVRASLSTVHEKVRRRLVRDAKESAGENAIVSRAEQETLPDNLLQKAAESVRTGGGRGARVTVDALVEAASNEIQALLGQVNQASGPGAGLVSEREVAALNELNPDAGKRVARAYQLITGKRITIQAPAAPSTVTLTAARIAQITSEVRRVASSGDMMTGEVPVGPAYKKLEVLRGDPAANGRTYTVYIPVDAGTDPNGVERMWILSVDEQGVQRVATLDVPRSIASAAPSAGATMSVLEASLGTRDPQVRGEIEVFNESGDNGVNTFADVLPGASDLESALAKAKELWSSSWGFSSWDMDVQETTSAQAIESFLTAARDIYAEEGRDPAEVNSIIDAFAERVQRAFGALENVRLVTGRGVDSEPGGTYLFGKAGDAWVGLAVRQYRDG